MMKSIKVVLISFTLMLMFTALSSAALNSISSGDELTLSFSEIGLIMEISRHGILSHDAALALRSSDPQST
jgi:hypothetical protein